MPDARRFRAGRRSNTASMEYGDGGCQVERKGQGDRRSAELVAIECDPRVYALATDLTQPEWLVNGKQLYEGCQEVVPAAESKGSGVFDWPYPRPPARMQGRFQPQPPGRSLLPAVVAEGRAAADALQQRRLLRR